MGAGVIDADYRGNVSVILFNFATVEFKIKRGDRIAQLITEKKYFADLEEVTKLDKTERETAGFGSSGI